MDNLIESITAGVFISILVWLFLVEPARFYNRYTMVFLVLVWSVLVPVYLLLHPGFDSVWFNDPVFSRTELVLVASSVFFIQFIVIATVLKWKLPIFFKNKLFFTYVIYAALAINIAQCVYWQFFRLEDRHDFFITDTLNGILGLYLLVQIIAYVLKDKKYIGIEVGKGGERFPTFTGSKTVQIDFDLSERFILLYSVWHTVFTLRVLKDYRSVIVIISTLLFPLFLWSIGHDWLQSRPMCVLGTLIFMTYFNLGKNPPRLVSLKDT